MMVEERPILIENDAGETRAGSLRVVLFSRRERWIRALKMLGLMWILAAITLFIPIAHFVLVPGFLIAGPVTAVMRFQAGESMESASGECPTCGKAMVVALDPAASPPLWTYCTPTNDPVRLRYP